MSDQGTRFPESWQPLVEKAADALRLFALNETAKTVVRHDPALLAVARRIAQRYIGGESLNDALHALKSARKRGHAVTEDYMGESCRDPAEATAETAQFLELVQQMDAQSIDSSVSLDLSHIGSVIGESMGFDNALTIAQACHASGREMIISMEGTDRVDSILAIHAALSQRLPNVGITVQARLFRTANDLPKLLERSGKIRLVKGAYVASEAIADARNSKQLAENYREYAKILILAGHECSIATHDRTILDDLDAFIQERGLRRQPVEFEMLQGLWSDQLNVMKARGHATREYVVFGKEWFLYVCNRMAEEPMRVYQALVDALSDTRTE